MMDTKLTVLFITFVCGQVFSCTTSGWSGWINKHKPSYTRFPDEVGQQELSDKQTGGDYENRDALPTDFCPQSNGRLTNIECVSETGTAYAKAQAFRGQGIACNLATGFKCSNRMTVSGFCLDYKVRYYCNCTGSAMVTKVTSVERKTTRAVTKAPVQLNPGTVTNTSPYSGSVGIKGSVTSTGSGIGSISGQASTGASENNQGETNESASTKTKNAAVTLTTPRSAIVVVTVITWLYCMTN